MLDVVEVLTDLFLDFACLVSAGQAAREFTSEELLEYCGADGDTEAAAERTEEI